MKKLITLTIALLLSTLVTIAGNGKSINSVISKELKIPKELKGEKLNAKVNVQFKLTSTGEATVMNVETTSAELKSYILTEFPKLNFKNVTENKEGVYFIDINFKVI
ncbi:hypothetical protein BH10BAC1_BH10BAC1_16160 [soil metagenome]